MLPESGECVGLLHELLALESRVEGAAGGVPHFLAVATYNLQHPSTFTEGALAGLRRAVEDVLDGRATIAEVRRRAGAGARGTARVKRRDGELSSDARHPSSSPWPSHWPTTVLDVCRLAPEQYVDHVTRWARDTIRALDAALGRVPAATR